MSTGAISFVVHGVPQPKGSARAFLPKGWTRPVVTSDNPKNKGWQQLVAEAAHEAIHQTPGFALITGAVSLTATFYLPRPKAIRDRMVPHTKRPDLDKLLRSCKDALSRVVWHDDSQVDDIRAQKRYAKVGEPPRAVISITRTEVEQRRLA